MPRKSSNPSHVYNSIPDIFQNNFVDISIWAWVTSAVKTGITQSEAMMLYRDHFGLDEDSAPLASLNVKYWRLNKQFRQAQKSLGRVIVHIHEPPANDSGSLGPILESLTFIIQDMRKSK